MGDYHQFGPISTLHKLSDRPVESLEADLVEWSATRPMALVIPALYFELEGTALPNILDELTKVPYLEEIIVGTYDASAVAQNGIFNNISQLWNHNQFWEMMGPGGAGMPGELESFEQCWLTGTAAEVTPVGQIGDFNFEVGEMCKGMAQAYEELVRA